jgi:hypothetical protein
MGGRFCGIARETIDWRSMLRRYKENAGEKAGPSFRSG